MPRYAPCFDMRRARRKEYGYMPFDTPRALPAPMLCLSPQCCLISSPAALIFFDVTFADMRAVLPRRFAAGSHSRHAICASAAACYVLVACSHAVADARRCPDAFMRVRMRRYYARKSMMSPCRHACKMPSFYATLLPLLPMLMVFFMIRRYQRLRAGAAPCDVAVRPSSHSS